jgi:hypothetical protein
MSLNVVGTIVVTSGMWKNNNTNKEFLMNPYLLKILNTFVLFRHKVDEVFESIN